MSSPRRRGTRAATVGAIGAATVIAVAGPAVAHVTVQPGTAAKGGYGTVAFQVPNEQDSASTIKVEVTLPADRPIASVQLQPVPGWTAQVSRSKLATPLKTDDGTVDEAVTKITWTGGKIAPGEFQQFPVSLGPLPDDTGTLVFKTLQTYDNGDVSRWIQAPRPGTPEPEDPAPTLTLTAAGGAGDTTADGGGDAKAPATPAPAPAAAAASSDGDTTARALGTAGIVVGALGVGYGVLAGRRRGTSSTDRNRSA